MATDPWGWTVDQVANFFRHDAVNYISDMPNTRLPDMHQFAQNLVDNDVSGAALLTSLDVSFLKDECGIRTLGMRSAIQYCVSKLKSESAFLGGKKRVESPLPQTPASLNVLPQASVELTGEIPVFDPIGDSAGRGKNIRNGEVEVQDERGRKRRRLDLQPAAPVQPANVQPAPSDPEPSTPGFLSDAGLPVDKIFYGKTKINKEIDLGSDEGFFDEGERVLDEGVDQSYEYFQLRSCNKPQGERHYVYKQMRHLFQNKTTHDIEQADVKYLRRKGEDAVAFFPYHDSLFKLLSEKKARSATVVRLHSDDPDKLVARRENAAHLDADIDYDDVPGTQTDNGTHDYLLLKWRQNEDDLLPTYGDSDSESTTSSLRREILEEEEEKEEESSKHLTREQMSAIIEQTIAEFIDSWNENKKPRLEDKSAWTIWKKTKQSRVIRDQLVEQAKSRISELSTRLEKQKIETMREPWDKVAKLKEMCSVMDVTLYDIQMEKWKIDVWQRKQEPHHVVHHGQHAHAGSSTKAPASAANPGPVIHPDDRMSVEPPAQDDSIEEEQFHPEGSPVHDEGNDGDESDQMSVDDEDYTAESPGFVVEDSPPPQARSNGLSGESGFKATSDDEEEIDDDDDHDDQLQAPGANESGEFAPGSGSGSESSKFPSPRALFPPSSKSQKPTTTPVKKSKTTPWDSPIVISSDSGPSAKKFKKKTPASARVDYGGNPEVATYSEAKAWDMEDLIKREDRIRLLIKLLIDAGPEKRKLMNKFLVNLRPPTFAERLLQALLDLRPDLACVGETDEDQTMFGCARVFLAYHFCKPAFAEGREADPEWQKVIHKKSQALFFTNLLGSLLRKEQTKLFAVPKTQTKSQTPAEVIELNELSDSDGGLVDTPSKKRKARLAKSSAVKQSQMIQANAFERQKKFKAAQSQPGYSQQLSQNSPSAVQSTSSISSIPINISRDDDEEAIFVDQKIAKTMKEHQIAGVQFMWREITAGDDAQGCILAHTMGLGKTLQTITLLIALNEAAQSKNPRILQQLPEHLRIGGSKRQLRALVLCPPSLLANWRNEIKTWAPEKLANVWTIESTAKVKVNHKSYLKDWVKSGGVVLIGYETFRTYVGDKVKKNAKGGKDQDIRRYLTEEPEIVIADEAHKMKEQTSQTSLAARLFKTESRIALTGTPMSNDVQEIYALVSWVAPDYLGDAKWFNAQYAKPIKDSIDKESTSYQRRKGLKKLAVLHLKIEPKVDRAGISVLRGSLSTKVEFVITLPLFGSQLEAYKKYVAALLNNDDNQEASQVLLFSWLQVLTLLTNHPLCFKKKLLEAPKNRQKSRELCPAASENGSATPRREGEAADDDEQLEEAILKLGFSQKAMQDIIESIGDDASAALSAKMALLLDIVRLSKECGDKVLIFSYYLPVLDYVADLLTASGVSFGQIDGRISMPKRVPILKEFQNGKLDAMVISTKAGGVGLNIQKANRVIILDAHFNPTYEEQAIGRSYRLGQKKPVFVYRFMVGGTFETNIYDKQKFKIGLANRVVDKKNTKRAGQLNSREYLYEPRDVPLAEDLETYLNKDEAVLTKILQREMQQPQDQQRLIRALETMETLQEEEPESLTNEEQQEVNQEFQEDQVQTRGAKKGFGFGMSQSTTGGLPPRSTQPAPRTKNPQAGTSAGGPSRVVRLNLNGVNGVNSLPASTAPPPRANGSAHPRLPTSTYQPQPQNQQPQMPHGLPDFEPTGPKQ